MADTTYRSVLVEGLPAPEAFDVKTEPLVKELQNEWMPKLRFTAWLMANGQIEYGVRRGSISWDKDDSEPTGWTLQRWGALTTVDAHDEDYRRRLELKFDYNYLAMTRNEITKLQTDDIAIRDIFGTRFDRMKGRFRKLLNTQLASGAGAEYTADGGSPAQEIRGYQNLLATSYSGSYAQVAISGNPSMQHVITNGDSGPGIAFSTDAIRMTKQHLRSTVVDAGGEEMQSDVMFSSLDTYGIIENAFDAAGLQRINFEQSGTGGNDVNLGIKGLSFYQIPLLRDETITTKRLYSLYTPAWKLYSHFNQLFQIDLGKKIQNTVGDDSYDIIRYGLCLVCNRLRPQGVLYYV